MVSSDAPDQIHLHGYDIEKPVADNWKLMTNGERAVKDAAEGSKQHTTIVGRFDPRAEVKEGEIAEVAVDTRGLHFFDPETGLGIYDEAKKGA